MQLLDLSFHFGPEHLLSTHATEIFKAVTSDSNTAKDTKDPVGDAQEDEGDLDEGQDRLLSPSILTKNRVADHKVTKGCNPHGYQPIPSRVT